MRNLHVPLPQGLYDRLRQESERTGQPGTALVREAVDVWLSERERTVIRDEVARYAREVAGSMDDLDTELEAASLDSLERIDDLGNDS